jgi:dihydrolipoamide dehydrogenase
MPPEEPIVTERHVDVAIIGAGSAGLYALGQVRRSGRSFVLIDGGELGTTCARVGCMPSKALLQVAEDFHRRRVLARYGATGEADSAISLPRALEHVQHLRDTFVDRVISNSTDKLGDAFIAGNARFVAPKVLDVDGQRIHARAVVIATGSKPIVPAAWAPFRDRVLTTDELFEQENLPASLAVIGLGAIGLELGQALARLGVAVTGIDLAQTIGGITDPEVARVAIEVFGKELPLWLGAAAQITPEADGRLRVRAGEREVVVDKVLASLGRAPRLASLGLEAIGVPTDAQGMPRFDRHTLQVEGHPIFLAGDVTGERPLLHEAGDEGRIAGYNATADAVLAFRRKVPLAITFCDPNISAVGARHAELDPDSTAIGQVAFGPVGRAMIMGKNAGLLRVYADRTTGCLLGAEMVAPKGEHLAHLLNWCITQGLTVGRLLRMPFYHPVIEEALQAALYDLYAKVDAKNDGPITELEAL